MFSLLLTLLTVAVPNIIPGVVGGWYGSWSAVSASCSLEQSQVIVNDTLDAKHAAAGAALSNAEATVHDSRAQGTADHAVPDMETKHAAAAAGAGAEGAAAAAGGGIARCSLGQQFLQECLAALFLADPARSSSICISKSK
jgi:hypothetical protein